MMRYGLMIATAGLVLLGGVALAQTSYSETTTTTEQTPLVTAPVPPPPGTLSTTETEKSVDANGDEYESTKTTYGANGDAGSDSSTVSVTPPTETTIVTKKYSTTSTSN